MARRGKRINTLVVIIGLALNVLMFRVVLHLWPRGFNPMPVPALSIRSPVEVVKPPEKVSSPAPENKPGPPSAPEGIRVIGGPSKIIHTADAGVELVTIDGSKYQVGEPWRGHRLPQVIDPLHPGLVMLPRTMTLEGRKIYVTPDTSKAFLKMAEAAALDGIKLKVDSGYRSAGYQRAIYRQRLADGFGFAEISRSVAPPGYSEHMLGCTLDLVPSNWSFKDTPADKWLRANAARFSFVQSYPANNPKGFAWEPWHWKYVGEETVAVPQLVGLAKDVKG